MFMTSWLPRSAWTRPPAFCAWPSRRISRSRPFGPSSPRSSTSPTCTRCARAACPPSGCVEDARGLEDRDEAVVRPVDVARPRRRAGAPVTPQEPSAAGRARRRSGESEARTRALRTRSRLTASGSRRRRTGRRPRRPARGRAARGARRSCRAASRMSRISPSLDTHGRTCAMSEASSSAFSRSKNGRSMRFSSFSNGIRFAANAREWSIRIRFHAPSTSRLPWLRSMFAMRSSNARWRQTCFAHSAGVRAGRLVDTLQQLAVLDPQLDRRRGRSRPGARRWAAPCPCRAAGRARRRRSPTCSSPRTPSGRWAAGA